MPQTCNKENSRALIANMTMAFRNCRPKRPNNTFRTQIEVFWSQVYFFSFWMKVYSFPNSRVLIESFISLIKSFKTFEGADFRHKFDFFFFCFWMKFCMLTSSMMLISNTALTFWNSSPKYPIKAILVLNLRIFIFGRNFVFGKIWRDGADVKYLITVAFLSSCQKISK